MKALALRSRRWAWKAVILRRIILPPLLSQPPICGHNHTAAPTTTRAPRCQASHHGVAFSGRHFFPRRERLELRSVPSWVLGPKRLKHLGVRLALKRRRRIVCVSGRVGYGSYGYGYGYGMGTGKLNFSRTSPVVRANISRTKFVHPLLCGLALGSHLVCGRVVLKVVIYKEAAINRPPQPYLGQPLGECHRVVKIR